MATPDQLESKGIINTPEKEIVPNPLVILDDVRLGLEVWGKFRSITVSDPDRLNENAFWAYLNQMYYGYLSKIYPNVQIVDSRRVSQQICNRVDEGSLIPVFLDSRIGVEHPKWSTHRLDICRITDETGNDLGLSSRPGKPDLNSQLELLVEHLREEKSREVMLVDDAVGPHAVTTLHIKKLLAEYGIKVKGVLAVLSFFDGRETLNMNGITLNTFVSDIDHKGDIINGCDLFPYHPMGGLKGRQTVYNPASRVEDMSVSFFYTPPFFPRTLYDKRVMVIPEAERRNLGCVFLLGSLMIFQRIRRLNGGPIRLRDFDAPAISATIDLNREVESELATHLFKLVSGQGLGLSK